MKQLAIDNVQKERQEGMKRLKIAVEETEQKCEVLKQQAIEETRKQEKTIAANEALKVAM